MQIMNDPIQLLHLGPAVPDLSTSPYGPFVVHDVLSFDEAAAALDSQHYDAIVLHMPQDAVRLVSGLRRSTDGCR